MSGADLFVTGAGGFVGRHLVAAGRERGLELVVSDADLLDPGAIERELRDAAPTRVAHLAAAAPRPGADPLSLLERELSMAANVLRALAGVSPGARALLVGSAAQYGMGAPDPLGEDAPLRPISVYGAIKTVLESACTAPPLAGDTRVIWARSFNHLGPGQPATAPVAAWARSIARIEAGADEPVRTGRLEPVRDFLDVRDVAAAYIALLEGDHEGVFNVCSGTGLGLDSVLEELVRLSSAEIAVETDPGLVRAEDPPVVVGDPGRLAKATGWAPGYGLRDSLADVLEDWRSRVREEANGKRDQEATWKA